MVRVFNIDLTDTQISYIITALRQLQEMIYNPKDDAEIDALIAALDELSSAMSNKTDTGIMLLRLRPR